MLGTAVTVSCSPLGGLCLRGKLRGTLGRFPALLPAELPAYVEVRLGA